jgi:hypothetical protein
LGDAKLARSKAPRVTNAIHKLEHEPPAIEVEDQLE